MIMKCIVVVLAVALLDGCHGYSLGAPPEACQEMFPVGHNTTAQTSSPPFYFTLNTTSYTPGSVIEVFLNSTGEWFLEGLLVQMRSVDCTNDKAVGTFSIQAGDEFLKPLNCFNTPNSALTHYSHLHIYNRTFYWTAPNTAKGHLYLRATIARNQKTFWTNVYSDYVMDTSDTSTTTKRCPVKVTSASTTTVPSIASLLVAIYFVFIYNAF